MIPDTVLKCSAMNVLVEHFGLVDAERFVALMSREPFDYTHWQKHLFEDVSVDNLSRAAMSFQTETFPEKS